MFNKKILAVLLFSTFLCSCETIPADSYQVSFYTTYVGLNIDTKYVKKDEDLNAKITIDPTKVEKILPNSLDDVTSNGKSINYTYTVNSDRTSATLKVSKSEIAGAIKIKITLVKSEDMKWSTTPVMGQVTELKVGDVTYYSTNITGIAENISNKDLSYVSVSFSFYDADGVNIGSALDNTSNLKKGTKWSVDASLSLCKSKPVRFETNDFTTL